MPDMRTGYFATLVALLSNFEKVTIPQVLELIKKELHSNGSSKSVSIVRNSYSGMTDQCLLLHCTSYALILLYIFRKLVMWPWVRS